MAGKFSLFLLFIFMFFKCVACTEGIPDEVRKEYGSDILNAFTLQSEGASTTAMFHFEQGCMKALNGGEALHKIEAIRKLFTWYRTFGYFLGLIKKDPQIFGQYLGNGKYSSLTYRPRVSRQYGINPEHDAKSRDFILGVTEILSGILCFYFIPPPYKVPLGAYLVDKGYSRAWEASNALWLQKDISMLELQKAGEALKSASM